MERVILEDNIYYYKNAIPDHKKFIEVLEATENKDMGNSVTKWNEWTACSGEMYLYGAQKTIQPTEEEKSLPKEESDVSYLYNTIMDLFHEICVDYAEAHGDYTKPVGFPLFDVKRYMEGTYMGAHFDQQEGDTRLRYSLVFYLNDDYEGGELSFTIESPNAPIIEGKPQQDFSLNEKSDRITLAVKPEAGSVIIFPSYAPYHHTAHLVKSGYKYMVPLHWYNLPEGSALTTAPHTQPRM
jgi:hypothetical protein